MTTKTATTLLSTGTSVDWAGEPWASSVAQAMRAIDLVSRRQLISCIADAAQTVSGGNGGFVVVGARRQKSVTDTMTRAKFQPPAGVALISDRFLLLSSPDNWVNKRIILTDDTTRSGKTADRANRVASCVWDDEQIVVPDDAVSGTRVKVAIELKGDDTDPATLARQMAQAFLTSLSPLVADSCMSQEMRMPDGHAAQLYGDAARELWRFVDIANAAVMEVGGQVCALCPTGPLLERLIESFGPAAKLVRELYFKVYLQPSVFAETKMRVVPIIHLQPLPAENVERWIDKLGVMKDNDDCRAERLKQAFHLVAYALSRIALRAFSDIINEKDLPFGKVGGTPLAEDDAVNAMAFTPDLEEFTRPGAALKKGLATLAKGVTGTGPQAPVFDYPDEYGDAERFYTRLGDSKGRGDADGTPSKFRFIGSVPLMKIILGFFRSQVANGQQIVSDTDVFKAFFAPGDSDERSFIIPDLCIDILGDVSRLVPEVVLEPKPGAQTLHEAHRLGEADEDGPQAFTGGTHSAFEFCKFFTTEELSAMLEVTSGRTPTR